MRGGGRGRGVPMPLVLLHRPGEAHLGREQGKGVGELPHQARALPRMREGPSKLEHSANTWDERHLLASQHDHAHRMPDVRQGNRAGACQLRRHPNLDHRRLPSLSLPRATQLAQIGFQRYQTNGFSGTQHWGSTPPSLRH